MVFAQAAQAQKPKNDTVKKVAWAYVAIVTVMAILQLYAFEDFIPLIQDLMLPGGYPTAVLVACTVVFIEIFSVPFLLRMELSPLMRWFSLVCSVLVPVSWLFLSLWLMGSGSIVAASAGSGGMLGAKVAIPNAYQLVLSLTLLAAAAYAAYGLWPVRKK